MYHHCTLRVDADTPIEAHTAERSRSLTIAGQVMVFLPYDPSEALAVIGVLRAALDELAGDARSELQPMAALA